MAIRGQFIETVVGSPPEGWSLGHVTLHLRNPEERIPVEAWRRGAFAVHALEDGAARLTHAPSGMSISSLDSMDDAAAVAELLEPLADWEAIKDQMPWGSDLFPKVENVIDEYRSKAA